MTKKEQLIKRLNELRTENNLPVYDPKKLKMSCEEIEGLIYHLETPSHSAAKHLPPPPSVAALLAKLNVLRKRAKEKPLKCWNKSRADIERAIKDMERELVEEAMLKHKRGLTKIAEGADTRKTHTDLHSNPIVEDMKKMRKKEERQRIATAKDTARKIALWAGYKASNVLAYLLAKNQTTPALAGEALKADIKAWLAVRDDVLPQRRGKPQSPVRLLANDLAAKHSLPPERLLGWLKTGNYSTPESLPKAWLSQFRAFLKSAPAKRQNTRKASGSVTPQDIATAASLDAKQVRVRLRKIESKIPKAWRTADERWGFKPEHKADIVKLVKG